MNASGNAATAAVNRFGLGAQPGELAAVHDARRWLKAQLARGPAGGELFAELPGSLDYLREQSRLLMTRRELKRSRRSGGAPRAGAMPAAPADGDSGEAARKQAFKPYLEQEHRELLAEVAARYRVVASTDTPFVERLVHFWSNHFSVSVDKRQARMFAAPMEREAIRPHVTGRFVEMLLAVETHPAMLLYLDNVLSVGPNSRLGQLLSARSARKGDKAQGKAGGLNENLGREAMELHTVGVDAGYTQADVTELSRALTGWGVPSLRDYANDRQPTSAFVFRAVAHEPGERHVMGRAFPAGGFEQGKAILEFLARKPATAAHLSLQLARHFVADDPPQSLVDRMAASYLEHDTDLASVYRALIDSPEAWSAEARKFRSPQDFLVASVRAGRIDLARKPGPALALLKNLGEPLFGPGSPAGFPDNAAHWIDADGLWKRVQAAEALAARVAHDDGSSPLALAHEVLGPMLDEDTAQAIQRAESRRQAHATLFACPAFQWRT